MKKLHKTDKYVRKTEKPGSHLVLKLWAVTKATETAEMTVD